MTDVLVELGQNPLARNIVSRVKLPIPMPEKLERPRGAAVERSLEGRKVLVAGEGALGREIARTLARCGAEPLLHSAGLAGSFAEPAEAFGRPARRVGPEAAGRGERVYALVFDATGIESPRDLRLLYDVLHAWLRDLRHSGRVVIAARPPHGASSAVAAAARAALDGLNRSLAKEIGGKGATSNLVIVEEGAEDRLSGVLRFFLSPASAFVTAQPVRVDASASWDGEDPWVQPLAGKAALVTGAARGIGAATARALAAEGARVTCLDRPDDDLPVSRVAREIGGVALLADVAEPDAPARIAAKLEETHGGVDIVVHNAGVTRDKTLSRMGESLWDQAIAINLESVLRITEALLTGALRDGGRIVSLSSVTGIAGNRGQTNYGATKAGLIGFTRHLAKRVAPRGITVNAVAPGFIETRMTAAVPLVVREAGRRLSALGQGGLPEDVAHAITFLSTPGAAGVTGNVLRICGGALLGA